LTLTITNVYPKPEGCPATAAAITAFQTFGPGTPSVVSPWSFSNAISAPFIITPEAPGCQKLRSSDGVLAYFQVNLPAGGLIAAAS